MKHVMIIDSDPIARSISGICIQKVYPDADINYFSSIQEVTATEKGPDLVLMSLYIPYESMIKEIKQELADRADMFVNASVIGLTVFSNPCYEALIGEGNLTAVIEKPFNVTMVKTLIDQ